MKIKYQIIEVQPEEHQIVVRYYTDLVTPEMLAVDVNDGKIVRTRTDFSIDLPIPTPIGRQLHELIMRAAPADFLDRMENILNPNVDTSMDNIKPLVGQEFTCEKLPTRLVPERVASMGVVTRKRPSADHVGVTEF